MALRNDCNTSTRFGSDSDEALAETKTSSNNSNKERTLKPNDFCGTVENPPLKPLRAWYRQSSRRSNRPLARPRTHPTAARSRQARVARPRMWVYVCARIGIGVRFAETCRGKRRSANKSIGWLGKHHRSTLGSQRTGIRLFVTDDGRPVARGSVPFSCRSPFL